VNAPALLTAFHGNNTGAIRMIKKEEGYAQIMLFLGSEKHTKTLKPQPHTAGYRVMYSRSIETMIKGSEVMAEPEQNSPSPSHTSS
jgi:hypothetical protein